MKAKDLMTTDVVTVVETATARETIEAMVRTDHRLLPVTNDAGRFVGAVTQLAFVRLCLPKYAEQIGDLAFLPDDFEPFDHRLEKVGQVQVSAVMDRAPLTATEDTAVVELAALMTLHEVDTLPILRDGKVVGIVGLQDLVGEIVHPHAR